MKFSFYPKLAADGMRKNKGLYIPYLLTCIGMVMMHYIVAFLEYSDTVSLMPGADTIKICMMLGSRVIAVFACLFLFLHKLVSYEAPKKRIRTLQCSRHEQEKYLKRALF